MAELVTMPKLGFDMAEGTLVRWVIAEGEKVEKGAVLAEIETDKATVEVESNASGTLLNHLVEKDSVVPVNTPIAVIGEPGEKVDLASLTSAMAAPVQIQKPAAPEMETTAQPVAPLVSQPPAEEPTGFPGGVKASPLARKLGQEKGVDLRNIHGSGPQGRITKEDVEAYLAAGGLPPAAKAVAEAPGRVEKIGLPPMPVLAFQPGVDRRVPLSKLRATIGRRMAASLQSAPHFFVTHEYDVEELARLRQQVNEFSGEGGKTSINDYFVRAVALTLREFPNLNASLDEAKGEVVQHGAINVGVAVALENGLITVVCRNTDAKTVRQISGELTTMVGRARAGKVRPDDIEGSTFSVSNLGMFEVDQFTAIINPPEAAILAVGSIKDVAVVEDGIVQVRKRMKATLSVDHRISDGAEAARFLQALGRYLSNPLSLLV